MRMADASLPALPCLQTRMAEAPTRREKAYEPQGSAKASGGAGLCASSPLTSTNRLTSRPGMCQCSTRSRDVLIAVR